MLNSRNIEKLLLHYEHKRLQFTFDIYKFLFSKALTGPPWKRPFFWLLCIFLLLALYNIQNEHAGPDLPKQSRQARTRRFISQEESAECVLVLHWSLWVCMCVCVCVSQREGSSLACIKVVLLLSWSLLGDAFIEPSLPLRLCVYVWECVWECECVRRLRQPILHLMSVCNKGARGRDTLIYSYWFLVTIKTNGRTFLLFFLTLWLPHLFHSSHK